MSLKSKELEKEERTTRKASRRKEIIKIRAEINRTENRETAKKTNETESLLFENISKTDKPSPRRKKRDRRLSLPKSGMEVGTSKSTCRRERSTRVREQPHTDRSDGPVEMDEFLEIQTLPGLDHAEIENKTRNITSKEIESVLKPIINLSTKKLDLIASPVNSMKHLMRN